MRFKKRGLQALLVSIVLLRISSSLASESSFEIEKIAFQNDKITLHGVVYRPKGSGPFPAVLYNHGSAKDSSLAAKTLGPVFANNGWVFFMPDRRGQGASASAGPYIMDEISKAERIGGTIAAAKKLVQLLENEHLSDQLSALDWLKKQKYIRNNSIAVHGNSFGGIEKFWVLKKVLTVRRLMLRELLSHGQALLS